MTVFRVVWPWRVSNKNKIGVRCTLKETFDMFLNKNYVLDQS